MNKYIIQHEVEGSKYANGFIVPNHYNHSLQSYMHLYHVALRDFPELDYKDVSCGTVLESGWCRHCPIISFAVQVDTVPAGWHKCDRLPDIIMSYS